MNGAVIRDRSVWFFSLWLACVLLVGGGCGGSSGGGTGGGDGGGDGGGGGGGIPTGTGPIHTQGAQIVLEDGSVWVGRGANLQDTRSCGQWTTESGEPLQDNATGVGEVERRADALVGTWHANFIRLTLESRRSQDTYVNDANYRGLIKQIVDHITSTKGVYVLLGIWIDPSLDSNGWPTDATNSILSSLATDFHDNPQVMYGVSNEPESNFDGALDPQVWNRMNSAVGAIRDAEAALGPERHIISVQGTRDWARDVSYYATHPIAAGGGSNVVYESHIYNSPSDFDTLLAPSATIPMILGEFGPVNDDDAHRANVGDMQTLMDAASARNVPYLAWTFHEYCPPNLIGERPGMTWDENSTDTDGIGITLNPTDFGSRLMADLASHA